MPVSATLSHAELTPTASSDPVRRAAHALLDSIGAEGQVMLAVSGGCDSMVLLDSVVGAISERPSEAGLRERVSVLTFDHGTGDTSTRAADLVVTEAVRAGLAVQRGRADLPTATEAEWRSARWSFLLGARRSRASIATAHTRDDQIETVVIRCLRGAGARGLAGLAAGRPHVVRPFLAVSRRDVRAYATERAVRYVNDPSNESRAHLRNRIRLDLLPAIRQVRPTFGDDLLDVADRAAAWRAEVDQLVSRYVSESPDERAIRVARHELATYDSAALCVLWPAIAARAGITLDRRGTRRLAQFTTEGASGSRMQLSGATEVIRERDAFVLRPLVTRQPDHREVPLVGVVELDGWRFSPVSSSRHPSRPKRVSNRSDVNGPVRSDCWTCDLPSDRRLAVRAWRPADRMRWTVAGSARRVKRFLADAKVSGLSRVGWPVVLADDEIVWIPGIRRSAAAPERSGRPLVRYTCERFERGPGQHS
jgi:tRNA(Ile)-lysidine synthase